jgi:hypothetical protein
MSPSPRDVPTQRQQRTKAEIFHFRHGTYFSQIVELFRVCKIVQNARNRRSTVIGATTYRHRMDLKRDVVRPRDASQNFFARRTLR